MRHLFDRPLGACAPCGYLFKQVGGEMAGAFISALGSMASTGLGAAINSAASERQHQYNQVYQQAQAWIDEQKMKQAYGYTNELMDKENAYNSPSAQMKRYREAGLNPYLAAGGAIGSGQSASKSAPSPSSTGMPSAPTPFYPNMDLGFSAAADKLVQASSLKSQRIAAESEFAKSLPDLVKGLGVDGAKRVASSVFGRDIDMQRIDDMIQNEYLKSQYDTKIKQVESEITAIYKPQEAANVIALQEQSFNKMAADIGYLASQGQLNEAKIKESASSYIRNLADAFKLRKEGDMYVASGAQYAALSRLVSLQGDRLRFENKANGYVDGNPLWNFFSTKEHTKSVIGRYKNQDYLKGDAIGFWVDRFFNDYVKVLGSAAPSGGASVTTSYSGY